MGPIRGTLFLFPYGILAFWLGWSWFMKKNWWLSWSLGFILGTLGFFGLGLDPESPNWGATINEGRKLLSIYPHPALPPAFALSRALGQTEGD